MLKIKQEDFLKVMEKVSKILGADPAYYGEEGKEEVKRQLKKLGYSEEVLKKI